MTREPISVYINWASYDELSDDVELTEDIAMRELDELLRLRKQGVRFDYYLMDAFWYARDGAYRTWRKPHFPKGPGAWLKKCLEHGVKPGLWVGTNNLSTTRIDAAEDWKDSLTADGSSACLFYGGFLRDFLAALAHWVERGVKLFKFDFAALNAAPAALQRTMLPSEIREANTRALLAGLKAFREAHPDVVLLAYNGFDEDPYAIPGNWGVYANTSLPFRRSVDLRWLEVFDSLYCGDPRPADVPSVGFWRSKDVYSDHMVRIYELNGVALRRIDNSGFMIGKTGTCYYRGAAAHRGMLVLSLARGGWVNTYYGNLELLGATDARWFAKAQSLYFGLQAHARIETFGALPGTGAPYGFAAHADAGSVFTVVNPSQSHAEIELWPPFADKRKDKPRLLFADSGNEPKLGRQRVTLGPEQLAVIGTGAFATSDHDLGREPDVVIPSALRPIAGEFVARGPSEIAAIVAAPSRGDLRIVMQQFDPDRGIARRTQGGWPPRGTAMDRHLVLRATQDGRALPIAVHYDKTIWSGLSWAAGEVSAREIQRGKPIEVVCSTTEKQPVRLEARVFEAVYG